MDHSEAPLLLIADRDPQTYVDDVESNSDPGLRNFRRATKDTSLGIGSLKGK